MQTMINYGIFMVNQNIKFKLQTTRDIAHIICKQA